jgi:hypothetical protein
MKDEEEPPEKDRGNSKCKGPETGRSKVTWKKASGQCGCSGVSKGRWWGDKTEEKAAGTRPCRVSVVMIGSSDYSNSNGEPLKVSGQEVAWFPYIFKSSF